MTSDHLDSGRTELDAKRLKELHTLEHVHYAWVVAESMGISMQDVLENPGDYDPAESKHLFTSED